MRAAWLLLLGWAAAAELVTVESRTVVGWPGLMLRARPSASSEILESVPFGQQVLVLSAPSTEAGGWLEVRSGLQSGFMAEAFLLPMAGPPSICEGFGDWVDRWQPDGPVVLERLDDPITGERVERSVQAYQGGTRRVWERRPHGAWGELWLPGVDLPRAWLAARRCDRRLAPVNERGWPPRGASLAGLSVRWSDDHCSFGPSGSDEPWVRFEQREGGTMLRWQVVGAESSSSSER